MSKKKNNFLLVTPSETRYLEMIRHFVAQVASIAGFDEEQTAKIQLSVDEACTNVIRHAYNGRADKGIRVQIEFDNKKLGVQVIDYGKGFDVHKVRLENLENRKTLYKRGGLGLYLIYVLMDEVKLFIKPNKKTTIKMVKYLDEIETPEQRKHQKILMERRYERRR